MLYERNHLHKLNLTKVSQLNFMWIILMHNNITLECRKVDDCHLKGDLSGHGEAVGDVGLLVLWPALPAVQLYTATAGQQHLPVHFHRRQTGQLTHCGQTDKVEMVSGPKDEL